MGASTLTSAASSVEPLIIIVSLLLLNKVAQPNCAKHGSPHPSPIAQMETAKESYPRANLTVKAGNARPSSVATKAIVRSQTSSRRLS